MVRSSVLFLDSSADKLIYSHCYLTAAKLDNMHYVRLSKFVDSSFCCEILDNILAKEYSISTEAMALVS